MADIELITRIAQEIGPKYIFGYHTKEDMVQLAVLYGFEISKNYRGDNLSVHIKNRLIAYRMEHREKI